MEWTAWSKTPLLLLLIFLPPASPQSTPALLPPPTLTTYVDRPPQLHWGPDDRQLQYRPVEGSSLELRCPLLRDDGVINGTTEIEWLREREPTGQNALVLSIPTLSRIDSGVYRCRARNSLSGSAIISPPFNITVAYLDGFLENSTTYDIKSVRFGSVVLKPPAIVAAGLDTTHLEWKWFKDDNQQQIASDETFFITRDGELVLPQVGTFGTYRVEAHFTKGTAYSLDYHVEEDDSIFPLSRPPFAMVYKPKDFTVAHQGQAAVFECVASSHENTAPELRWYLNGDRLVDDRVKLEFSNRRLTLPNAENLLGKGVHSAVVQCEAKSSTGDFAERANARLEILEAPVIDRSEWRSELSKVLGETLTLACRSDVGWPRAKPKWFFNGRLLPLNLTTSTLRIDSLHDADFALYQCEMANAAGMDSVSVWVRNSSEGGARRTRFSTPTPPPISIINPPVDSVVRVGDEIHLNCEPSDALNVSVKWRFNGSDLTKRGDLRMRITPLNHSLTISSAQRSDSGTYSCILRRWELGDHAVATERTAIVTVIDAKLIKTGPSNQSVLIGSNIQLPCSASDDIPPNTFALIWTLNNEAIPPTGDPQRRIAVNSDGGLSIRQVGPENIGTYRCTIALANGSVSESASARLRLIEKPSMPQSVQVSLANETMPARVRVEWINGFDGNSPITKYLVESRVLGASGLWSEWETTLDNIQLESCCSVLVDSVKPSATVQFRVTAFNRHGAGKPSTPSANITMPQQPPAAAPRGVGASPRSANSVMVQWQPPPPDQWNGDIKGYFIRYRLSGYTTAIWNERNVSNEHARNALIEPLITWREYEIQVAAYNERGLGVFSKPVEVTTMEGGSLGGLWGPLSKHGSVNFQCRCRRRKTSKWRPVSRTMRFNKIKFENKAHASVSSTEIRVSFDPPDQQQIPGVNLGYKVELWKRKSTANATIGEGVPFKRHRVFPHYGRMTESIRELEKFGHYNLTVLCFTSVGDGPRSDPVEVVTLEDVPGPVESFGFDQVMSTSVLVQWKPPVEPNGIILKYVIRYWESDGPTHAATDNKHAVEVSAEEQSHQIDDLSPSTHYTVDIQAVTNAGAGPRLEANFESGVTPTLPDKPLALMLSDVGPRSVVLQFTPGFNGHSHIKRWIVEGRVGSTSIFSTVYNISAPKAKSIVVEGLRPYTRYQLRLIAENVRGRGAPSDPTRPFQTVQTFPEHPPQRIYVEPASAEQLSIAWAPLTAGHWNGDPLGYALLYREANNGGDDNWSTVKIPNPKASEYRLDKLRPFTTYQVRMLSENSFGKSNASSIVVATTYESAPSSPPKDVVAKADGEAHSVKVRWSEVEPAGRNGLILGYVLRLTTEVETLHEKCSFTTEIIGEQTRYTQLDELCPATTYRVTVAAFTLVGEGPQANSDPPLVTTAESKPGKPSNVSFVHKSPSQLRLNWAPPVDANGRILGYAVRYWRVGQSEGEAVSAQFPRDMYLFTATSLTPNTTYHFGVRAETSIGFGDEQRLDVVTEGGGVGITPPLPSPVPPVRGDRSRSGTKPGKSLALSWPPSDTKEVRAVELAYQKANSDEWTAATHTVPGDVNDYLLTGLFPNTAYRVRMRFQGDMGARSAWSSESDWFKTAEEAPAEPPQLLQVKPYESSSVSVKWRPLQHDKWNGDSIHYRILYRIYPSNDSYKVEDVDPASNSSNEQEHVLSRLSSFHHYIVQLKSFNSFGSSRASKPFFVYVGYAIPKREVTGLTAESLSSTSIKVHWDEWQEREDDLISGYRVSYAPLLSTFSPEIVAEASGEGGSTEEVVMAEKNEHLLTDLRKYTEYQITVAGYNRAGEGPSSVIRLRTLEDRPGPVGQLDFHDILLDSVNVSWAPPVQPNGRIVGYVVNYRTYKLDEQFRKEVQEKTQLTYLVASNLEENTTYWFSVAAETLAGVGVESAANVTIGYNAGAPLAPSRPEIVSEQSGFLLRWSDGDAGKTPLLGHLIQAKRTGIAPLIPSQSSSITIASHSSGDGSDGQQHFKSRRETLHHSNNHPIGEWVTLTSVLGAQEGEYRVSYKQLEPASYYVFRLFARNQLGVGQASPESESLFVPDPFYTKWWFLTIVALLVLIVVMAFIAVLCFTTGSSKSSEGKSPRGGAFDTLQLSDGGIVSYELHSKHLRKANTDLFSRPGTHTSWISTGGGIMTSGRAEIGPLYGSIASGMDGSSAVSSSNAPMAVNTSLYQALATDSLPPHTIATVNGGGSHYRPISSSKLSPQRPQQSKGLAQENQSYRLRDFNAAALLKKAHPDPSMGYAASRREFPPYEVRSNSSENDEEAEEDEDEEEGSVAQHPNFTSHYQSSNPGDEMSRTTWRRAREEASQQRQSSNVPQLSTSHLYASEGVNSAINYRNGGIGARRYEYAVDVDDCLVNQRRPRTGLESQSSASQRISDTGSSKEPGTTQFSSFV